MNKLVIVESPTKAKTISKYLGKGYTVTSSFGHIRDLPKKEMGVDIKDGSFEPKYIIPTDKKKVVNDIKKKAEKKEIIFATDSDREGEAISWHLAKILNVDPKKAKRIAFHEITKHAIEEALEHPQKLNMDLVDAQQARRVLDRLVGYELSPFLWKKVARGLSAGRVQSVAVRLIVEREREIQNFKAEEYWTIKAIFVKDGREVEGNLYSINGKKVQKLQIKSEKEAQKILDALKGKDFEVVEIEQKQTKRNAPPPFTTSTLQQKANQSLGYSSKQTMRLAQQLYEGIELGSEGHTGLVTYMRTDSLNLSSKFINEANAFVEKEYGKKYASGGRCFKTKSKGAQEAHEAIRPTDPTRTPDSVKSFLTPSQHKLYSLIWKRAVASQMAEAVFNKTAISVEANKHLFKINGQTPIFDGWLKLYPTLLKEESLPEFIQKEKLETKEIQKEQHFTEPPARYSDATLVKVLEEHEVGRPSTYAPTISTIEARNYVERDENKRFKPTEIAFVVTDLLVKHFPEIVDVSFTANMENNLDKIAEGKKEWQPVIAEFYGPFHENLKKKTKEVSKKEVTEEKTKEKCDKCGSPMVIKLGRFGKFLACSNYPECKNTKPIDPEEKKEQKEVKEMNEKCEKCGKPMVLKQGRYGAFLGCSGYPECKNIKSFEQKTGVKCDACGKGEIVEKKSKKGRTFYACNRYPKCKNAYWNKPTGKKCPKCKSLLVEAGKDKIKCSSKDCDYKKAE